MRLSNPVLKGENARLSTLEFVPPKFELGTPAQALHYLDEKTRKTNDFLMSDSIRIQTGVSDLEARSTEQDVEGKVLERLKEVQESAYQEAYQLGLDDGRKEAFQKAAGQIHERLEKLEVLIATLKNLKKDLLHHNEAHLVQLAFQLASRLAHAEIQANEAAVVDVMRKAIELAQADENIIVQVCPRQTAFLEDLKKQTGREFEFLKKVRIEGVEGISEGGCIVETNYGQIDATFEQRVSKLWEAIAESLHRVKDRIGAA